MKKVKETIAKIIWNLRFLDLFFYFTLAFLKLEKASKEEKEEILRAIYDIRSDNKELLYMQKDYLIRLFFISLLSVFLLFFILLSF